MKELKELAEHLVELCRSEGADDAVAEAMDETVSQIRFSNSQVDAFNSWRERHVSLFAAIGKQVISSDLRDMTRVDELAKSLVASAKSTPPSGDYRGIAQGRFKYRPPKVDRSIIALRDPSRFVHEAIAEAESEGANNVGGTLYVHHEMRGLASSGGAHALDENAYIDLSVRAFSQPEASGHAVSCTPRLLKLDAKQTGRRAGEMAVAARNPVQGDKGKFDLLMEPLFLGSMIQSTTRMMSALSVEIGISMFKGKLGKKVASGQVTLIDDPLLDSTSRRSFDHEGVPARKNALISEGVLKTYLHSTSTSKRFKTKTTANAGPLIPNASGSPGQPIAFHPVIQPGDWKKDEMIEDTKRGLYLNNTWYTRYQNYSTGEFSTIPRDAILLIEDGEIKGAVKNIRVSDNMMNLWNSVDALGKDGQEVYWWDEASPPSTLPLTRATGMNITRSS